MGWGSCTPSVPLEGNNMAKLPRYFKDQKMIFKDGKAILSFRIAWWGWPILILKYILKHKYFFECESGKLQK